MTQDLPKGLTERARAVLYAAVTEFIRTGEPVGSRTLSAGYSLNLSAASIRNVFKDLEEAGFLLQPHTSAGRLPTTLAFRVFIDALMQVRQLSEAQSSQIQDLFSQNLSHGALLQESGRLLSELSGLPAVVLRSRGEARSVKKIRFVQTEPGQLLAVVILDDGSVENRFIRLQAGVEGDRLDRLHNLLDEATRGRSLSELRAYISDVASRERSELREVGELGRQLLGSAIGQSEAVREVIIEGRAQLALSLGEPDRIRRLLVALEDREQLIQLLDGALESSRVQVYVGQDDVGVNAKLDDEAGPAAPKPSPLSVVVAPYGSFGRPRAGALGTVGPQRMDYPGLVPLVSAMASAISQALEASSPEAGMVSERAGSSLEGPRSLDGVRSLESSKGGPSDES